MIECEKWEIFGWEEAIRGMRNPMNSWEQSDSEFVYEKCLRQIVANIGPKDWALMKKLTKAGPDHRKFMRMITVYVDITAPLYWWKEFDTYKVGTVANSCSTMHKIADNKFTLNDFSTEHLLGKEPDAFEVQVASDGYSLSPLGYFSDTLSMLNGARKKYIETKDKKYWWQMIQLLPSSYNQKRTVMLNYEVLANIYHSRKNHKLDEWREFCDWIKKLPYSELITGKENQ